MIDKDAPVVIQQGLENLHGERLHSLSRQPTSMLGYCEKTCPYIQFETLVAVFLAVSCHVNMNHREESALSFW